MRHTIKKIIRRLETFKKINFQVEKSNLKNHGNQGNTFQLPKDQDEPCNPDCVVLMHQLLNNKQHELQEVEPVI